MESRADVRLTPDVELQRRADVRLALDVKLRLLKIFAIFTHTCTVYSFLLLPANCFQIRRRTISFGRKILLYV